MMFHRSSAWWPISRMFVDRVVQEIACWMFVLAGGVAVSIAWLTVSVHAFAVARARPVEALRYE
jgi:putative ABC transport system permease protein